MSKYCINIHMYISNLLVGNSVHVLVSPTSRAPSLKLVSAPYVNSIEHIHDSMV